jgi:hypothetical protein
VLGRLRVLLILGLVVSPVTADLRHGFLWSVAASAPPKNAVTQPALPLYYIYPWCTFTTLKYYNASGRLYGTRYAHDPVVGNPGKFDCVRTMCVRHDWCISEASNWPGQTDYTPTKITNGCVQEICIAVRPPRPPP